MDDIRSRAPQQIPRPIVLGQFKAVVINMPLAAIYQHALIITGFDSSILLPACRSNFLFLCIATRDSLWCKQSMKWDKMVDERSEKMYRGRRKNLPHASNEKHVINHQQNEQSQRTRIFCIVRGLVLTFPGGICFCSQKFLLLLFAWSGSFL